MKARLHLFALSSLLLPASAIAQNTAFSDQVQVETLLKGSLSSRNAKAGDEISASLEHPATIGATAIPRGSLLLGHVVEVTHHTKDTPDGSVTVVFDHIKLKKGDPLAIRSSIYRIAPSEAQVRAGQADVSAGMRGSAAEASGTPALREGTDASGRVGQGLQSSAGSPIRVVSAVPGVALSAVASPDKSGIMTSRNADVQLLSGLDVVVGVSLLQ